MTWIIHQEQKVLNERLIDGEEYEIMLNVDVEDPYSIAISRYKKEYPDRQIEEKFLDNLYFSIQGAIEHDGIDAALEYAKNGKLW